MGIGILSIVVVIVICLILNSIVKLSLKTIGMCLLVILAVVTVWICEQKPIMHKPLSLNTIEYLLKINKDGSMTTTKQITTTGVKIQEGNE